MVALIVIGGIVLFFLLLLLCPLKVTLRMEEELSLAVQYAFLKIPILPAKEKPEKEKPKKEKKKQPEEAEGEKKPSFLKKLKDQHGVSGLIHLGKELLKLAGSTMKKLFSHVVVYHLRGDVRIGTGDAAETAILYGRVCAVVEPCMAVLLPMVPKKKRRDVYLYVAPDFASEVSDIKVYVQAGIKPLFLFSALFGALFRLIRVYLAANKRAESGKDNGKTKQEAAQSMEIEN